MIKPKLYSVVIRFQICIFDILNTVLWLYKIDISKL